MIIDIGSLLNSIKCPFMSDDSLCNTNLQGAETRITKLNSAREYGSD